MKPIEFLGDALKCLRDFPMEARRAAGSQLSRAQQGQQPNDFKPMPSSGKGVEEIRLWDDAGTFRVIYTARRGDAVYVLHAFQKRPKPLPSSISTKQKHVLHNSRKSRYEKTND